MRVKEAMQPTEGLDTEVTLAGVLEAIETTGCETLPIVDRSNGEVIVRQLVSVRDLPKLRRAQASAERGHVLGHTVLELLFALGRAAGRFPTIAPEATLVDAWGLMSDEGVPHMPVVAHGQVVGMLSLVVTFSEFPFRSPAAGFWAM